MKYFRFYCVVVIETRKNLKEHFQGSVIFKNLYISHNVCSMKIRSITIEVIVPNGGVVIWLALYADRLLSDLFKNFGRHKGPKIASV